MTSTVDDQIHNFADLNANYRYKVSRHLKSWKLALERSMTLFYKLDTTEIPRITVSIKISKDLRVRVFTGNHKVEEKYVLLLLDNKTVLGNWSQLVTLLNFFGSEVILSINHSMDYYFSEALNNLYRCLDNYSEKDSDERVKLGFLINQIALLRCKVYSQHTLDVAFSVYLTSSNCYKEIQKLNCLTFPTEKDLLEMISKNVHDVKCTNI